MFRNDLYAKFADIFDSPEEPRAVFQPDGKIEFVAPNGVSSAPSMVDVSDKRQLTSFKPSASLRKKMILFGIFCALVIILFVITLVNLIILVQNQKQVARNSKAIRGGELVINGTVVSRDQFRDAVVPLISQDVKEALQRFKVDIDKIVKDHPVTNQHINDTVNDIIRNWGGGVLQHLEQDMHPFDFAAEFQKMMMDLSVPILQTLRYELGIDQRHFQAHVFSILSNISTDTVNRLKEELEIDPVHLDMAVHRALNNLTERSLALIRGICETAYGGKCYWVVKAGTIPYKQAESLCEVRGAMAANIYNEAHYRAMLKYVRSKMGPMNSIWIGMVRDQSTGEIRYVNGTVSKYAIPWATGYPISSSISYQLGITYPQDQQNGIEGFINDAQSNHRQGILCEL